MNDNYDELDRALFAMPLEPVPPGLRESILRATIFAPHAVPAFKRWEIVGIGAALAIAAWLVLLAIADKAFGATLSADATILLRSLGEPTTLAWFATGGSLAILLSFLGSTPLAMPVRKRG